MEQAPLPPATSSMNSFKFQQKPHEEADPPEETDEGRASVSDPWAGRIRFSDAEVQQLAGNPEHEQQRHCVVDHPALATAAATE